MGVVTDQAITLRHRCMLEETLRHSTVALATKSFWVSAQAESMPASCDRLVTCLASGVVLGDGVNVFASSQVSMAGGFHARAFLDQLESRRVLSHADRRCPTQEHQGPKIRNSPGSSLQIQPHSRAPRELHGRFSGRYFL